MTSQNQGELDEWVYDILLRTSEDPSQEIAQNIERKALDLLGMKELIKWKSSDELIDLFKKRADLVALLAQSCLISE